MAAAVSDKRKAKVKKSTISLQFDSTNDDPEGLRIQNALLPYFAMGFTPTYTSGDGLQCGLYALSISYHAARNSFLKPGDAPIPEIPIEKWREWLKSDDYEHASRTVAATHTDFYPLDGGENWTEEMSRDKNLGGQELSILLHLTTLEDGTNFKLGIIREGYKGRRTQQGGIDVFDDTLGLQPLASMESGPMPDEPIVWIFNDNKSSKYTARGETPPEYNHWEGFKINDNLLSETADIGDHALMVYNYGVGALVERDIEQGVWFLTEDSEPGDDGSHILAYKGTFLRMVDTPDGFQGADDNNLYMRTCKGTKGLVSTAIIQKIVRVERSPCADTDESHANGEGNSSPTQKDSGNAKYPNKTSPGKDAGNAEDPNKSSKKRSQTDSKNQNPMASKRPRKGDNYEYKRVKIFRIIPPTNKASIRNDENRDSSDPQKMKTGDFVLDTTERTNLKEAVVNAVVKDRSGVIGKMPLRRLRALENPWRLPDELPILDVEKYEVPDKYSDVITLATANGITSIPDERSVRKKLEELLTKRKSDESVGLDLYSITENLKSENNLFLGMGEAVMKGEKKETLYNYEGYEGRNLGEKSIDLVEAGAWGIVLNRQEFERCPWIEKQEIEEAVRPEGSDEDVEEGEVQEKSQPKNKLILKSANKMKKKSKS